MTFEEALELLSGLAVGQRVRLKSGRFDNEGEVAQELHELQGQARFRYSVLVRGPKFMINVYPEHLVSGRQEIEIEEG